jgi:tetratricopeptide (TPR) repeat protein
MDGDAKGALSLAAAEVGQLPTIKPGKVFAQLALGTTYFVYGRYGSRAEVAALADPGAKLPYAQAMWRYAKGEAAARGGDAPGVRAQAAAIAVAPAELKKFGEFASQAGAMVDVARLVLTGRAAMLEGRFTEAEAAYRKAADIQEARLGELRDPPAWWYPVRRSLAAALEAQGKPQAAAVEARKAMVRWPFEPVRLDILADSERRVGQADDARRQLAYARANWTGDVSGMPLALR